MPNTLDALEQNEALYAEWEATLDVAAIAKAASIQLADSLLSGGYRFDDLRATLEQALITESRAWTNDELAEVGENVGVAQSWRAYKVCRQPELWGVA